MAKPQNKITETASTMVVMKGFATTAGSKRQSFARIGNNAPTNLAMITVQNNARETIKHTCQV